ncbi:MAG TPA: cyclodeaminase/cyclohydrolase family protein [Vicinamibacteria bacterium]|nr:cyclodeaminase/cyclohydrolase family protein [Vicinamibacteria bacterium]
MSLLDLPARELLDRFASAEPTPGGGSASALAGALAASLLAMVCALDRTRSGAAAEREQLDAAGKRMREAGERLRRLVDDDSAAYDAVVAAYRLPRTTEEEKAARKGAVSRAMACATEVPRETARTCLEVMRASVEAATHGNPNALSDARTAGALAWAGLLGAVENVRINLGPQPDASTLAELAAVVSEARASVAALGLAIG